MIQLYIPSNQNFEMNGNITLEATLCDASFNLNSVWNLELEAPIKYIDYIVKEAVVKVPTPYKNQLYRIYSTEKDEDTIYAWAYPIFLDAKNDCFLFDVRPTDKNGQEALDIIYDGTKYSGKSNITKVNTAYIQQKNGIAAINGDDDNTFLKRWGGEIAYNNYQIIINERLGSDNGARAEFGYNLASIKENVDMSNVVTRIIPKAYNGILLPNQEVIDSPNIDKYAVIYTKVIEYSDIKLAADAFEGDADMGYTICDTLEDVYTALRERANAEFANGIDLPTINYEVDIVDLSNCDDYKDIKTLVELHLGDDIYCKNKRLNIETKARVIGMKYDCITKKTKELTIGDYKPTVFDSSIDIINRIENVINKGNNTIMAEKVNGVLDMLKTSLRAQKNAAQKSDVRAILFEDTDTSSPTFGAMSIGTQGIQITKKRNETNTDWDWTNTTAMDFQSIYANYIIAGILSDKTGANFWNLDTGEFQLASSALIGGETLAKQLAETNTNANNYTDGQVDELDDRLNQSEVFNRLTNNGAIPGIFMKNGQLYINASYLATGILSDALGKFYLNMSTGELVMKDGTFTGKLVGSEITSTNQKQVTYTSSDVTKLQNYFMNGASLTEAEKERFDVNCDGRIRADDLATIKNLLGSKSSITVTVNDYVEVDPKQNSIVVGRKINDTLRVYESKLQGGTLVTNYIAGTKLNAANSNGDADVDPNGISLDTMNGDKKVSVSMRIGTASNFEGDGKEYKAFTIAHNIPDTSFESLTFSNGKIITHTGVDITKRSSTLWAGTGAWYMGSNHTIDLNDSVKKQRSGIVLVWQAFEDGEYQSNIATQFVPKNLINALGSAPCSTFMATGGLGKIGTKIVYVSDTKITGTESNDNGTETGSGVTYCNNYWVLRYVIGV